MTDFSAKFKLPCFKINGFITSSFPHFLLFICRGCLQDSPSLPGPGNFCLKASHATLIQVFGKTYLLWFPNIHILPHFVRRAGGEVLKFIFIRSYLLFQEKPYRAHLINPGTFHNKFKGLLVQEDNSEG
jgi:hypothetical protein